MRVYQFISVQSKENLYIVLGQSALFDPIKSNFLTQLERAKGKVVHEDGEMQ